MEYKIVSKDSFSIIGVELITTLSDEKDFGEIPSFWEKVLSDGLIDTIPNKKNHEAILGLSMNFKADGTFSYVIGAEVLTSENVPDGMVCSTIPAAQYAVFTAHGQIPKSIQDTSKYIYKEWFPKSEYKRTEAPEFELYDERCQRGENAEVDIYIPVMRS